MERLKIAILFGTKPNFDDYAFKYFILYVNKVQSTYEFCFPDIKEFVFQKKKNSKIEYDSSFEKIKSFASTNDLIAEHYIVIVTNSFSNNFFFYASKVYSVITTDVWDKYFSPPSLFEYLLHCIYTCLIFSQLKSSEVTHKQLLIDIGAHKETRGCIADFTKQKYDDRIDVILGYICDEHKREIKEYYGEKYLEEVQYIIERDWIGDLENKKSPAYNLKHIFKLDIFKDSGFNKNFWDKIWGNFYELPGNIIGSIITFILTVLLTYFLIKFGWINI